MVSQRRPGQGGATRSNRVSSLCEGWKRNVIISWLSYDEARQLDPNVDSRMLLAENAALSAHPFICEDGPEIPNAHGPYAEVGGQILERMYAQGCSSLQDSRIREVSGRAG
jgi:hypothetical protein